MEQQTQELKNTQRKKLINSFLNTFQRRVIANPPGVCCISTHIAYLRTARSQTDTNRVPQAPSRVWAANNFLSNIMLPSEGLKIFNFRDYNPLEAVIDSADLLIEEARLHLGKPYRYGVVAQFFYVGVQIMCWTFIIQYGTRVFMNEGMTEQAAEVLSQRYNIVAMAIFCLSRFICTFLLKYISPSKLLTYLGLAGAVLVLGVIFIDGRAGLYCLVAISACMSLMFPTIYGIALQGLGDDAKFGAAGLIMAILGGSVLPPLQALIIDQKEMFGMPAINVSFILPLLCFIVIIAYGYRTYVRTK